MDTVFFVASKLVWLLIRPETLLALVFGLAVVLAYRSSWAWARRFLTLGTLSMLAIGLFPVDAIFLRPLETLYPAEPSTAPPDGILVLGGAEKGDVTAHWGQPNVNAAGDRHLAALALAQRFPGARVVFTGGSGRLIRNVSDGQVAEAMLLAAGMDPDRLTVERNSRNTAENAAFTLAMIPEAPQGRWILLTSAYHMPRSVATFCAAGWRNIVPWPVDFRTLGSDWTLRWAFAENLEQLNIGVREWVGLLAYRLTGRAALPEKVDGCLAPAGAD